MLGWSLTQSTNKREGTQARLREREMDQINPWPLHLACIYSEIIQNSFLRFTVFAFKHVVQTWLTGPTQIITLYEDPTESQLQPVLLNKSARKSGEEKKGGNGTLAHFLMYLWIVALLLLLFEYAGDLFPLSPPLWYIHQVVRGILPRRTRGNSGCCLGLLSTR